MRDDQQYSEYLLDLEINKQNVYKGLDNLIPEVIYKWLFLGYSLRDIEQEVLGTDPGLSGWFSKCLLNYAGVKTTSHNRGIFKHRDVEEVSHILLGSDSPVYQRIGYFLSLYHKQ